MSGQSFPVSVAVTRPDGRVEHVRVGTATREGDGFVLRLGELAIGGEAVQPTPVAAARGGDGMVFPPYGRSKGAPIAGATMRDLEFYRSGCLRTLEDPAKARWHEKEKVLLAAIDAEIARQQGGGGGGATSSSEEGEPPWSDDDVPF